MFEKPTEKEVLASLNERKTEIRNLDKLPSLDGFYRSFLSTHEGAEITPDIKIFGYEEALQENRHLQASFPNIHQVAWLIGATGQGDEWFMHKENGRILFHDHDQGACSDVGQLLALNISFFEFLQMAFLYQKLESMLEEQENVSESQMNAFVQAVNAIHPHLYEDYPFKYF